jgi:two-component system NarL family sensor kinase
MAALFPSANLVNTRRSHWWLALLAVPLLLLNLRLSAAPTPLPDSLLRALHAAPTDTARAKASLRLSAVLAATDTARAGQYARQALALSTAAGFGYGQAHSWLQLSALAIIRSDNARAAHYGELAQVAAIPLYRQRPAPRLRKLLGSIANNRGNVADRRGQYAAATQFYVQAAAYLAPLGEATTLLTVYDNLGTSFLVLDQPARAAHYWRQAVSLRARTGPIPALVPVYLKLASLYLQQAQPDSADQMLRAAQPLVQQNSLYAGEYYGTLGSYYLQTQQLQQAQQALRQALGYAARKGAVGYQAKLLFEIGQLDAQAGDLAQARGQMLHSLALTEQLEDSQQLLDILNGLARLEEEAGQWQAALRYYQRRQQLRDTLASAAVHQQINQLEVRYRTQQQAQQLAVLRQTQASQQQALHQQRQLSALLLALLIALLGLGALGAALWRHRQRVARQRREQEKALLTTQAVLQGQEEERRRLARDLHDGLGGMLATVKLYLAGLRSEAALPPKPAGLLAQSIEHLDSSISELRQVARNLMPEALLTFGLAQALQDLCDAAQQASGLQVQLQTHGLSPRLDQATEVALYRLVQELLHNALRHAQARQVLVQLMRHADELHLVVEDDGCGFDPAVVREGVGLRSTQARARYLGGTLEVHSQPGQGTSVSLELRLTPQQQSFTHP